MNQALRLKQPLHSVIWSSQQGKTWRYCLSILIGSLLLAASSKITVSLLPIPVTMQTFAVLFIAMVGGWRIGAGAVALFLFEGALGLPVFAPGAVGLAALFGPSGGYLFGFFPAAVLTGILVERGWGYNIITTALAATAGMAVIYGYGLFWLTKFVGFHDAMLAGLTPFVIIAVLKILALAILVPSFWKPVK